MVDLPEMIADGGKVKLVLLNILANAVRYTPSGRHVRVAAGVVVDTTLEARFPHLLSSADAVRILIADEGPGISATDRPHVFELFYRGRGLGYDSSPAAWVSVSPWRRKLSTCTGAGSGSKKPPVAGASSASPCHYGPCAPAARWR